MMKVPQTARDHSEMAEHYKKKTAEYRADIEAHKAMLAEYKRSVEAYQPRSRGNRGILHKRC